MGRFTCYMLAIAGSVCLASITADEVKGEILCQNLKRRFHLQFSATYVFSGSVCPRGYQPISKLRPQDRIIPRGGQINRWIQEQMAVQAYIAAAGSGGESGVTYVMNLLEPIDEYLSPAAYSSANDLSAVGRLIDSYLPIGGSHLLPIATSALSSIPLPAGNTSATIGSPGATGPRGATGEIGPAGAHGERGKSGVQGAAGAAGERGERGESGQAGLQGSRGERGNPGEHGESGVQGQAGAKGERGDKGDSGARGLDGLRGLTGLLGPKGDTGEPGSIGLQGLQGLIGQQGLPGAIGEIGERGLQGLQGIAGEDGISGSSILSGLTDPELELGETGDFYINLVTTKLFGPKTDDDWGSGTSLIGAQGIQGLTGAVGEQGLQGIEGIAGAVGAAGAQGIQGLQGIAGAIGPQGLQGLQGLTGLDGRSILSGTLDPDSSTGSEGDFYINSVTSTLFGPKQSGNWSLGISLIGPQGLQGIQGLAGAIGPQGLQGLQGLAGAVGAQGPQGLQGLTGALGPQGVQGLQGLPGLDGKSILSGATDPDSSLGADGDFYINTATSRLFGPKQGGGWNLGINLIGQQGLQGLQGIAGAIGTAGPQGPQGPSGILNLGSCQQRSETISGLTNVTGSLYCEEGEFLLSSSWNFLSGTILNLQKVDLFTYESGTGPYNYPVGFQAIILLPILTNGSATLSGTCCATS